ELIIGNLNEEGYLIASDEELLGVVPIAPPEADVEVAAKIVGEAEALGIALEEQLPVAGCQLPDVSALAPEDFAASDAADQLPVAGCQLPEVGAQVESGLLATGNRQPATDTAGTATAPARI